MIRLRLRRRSLALAGAVCLAAAALVALSIPAEADTEAGATLVTGDYLKHVSPVLVCAGPVRNSTARLLVA
ncbi:hypothetical protein [Nocardia sp. NBC_00511]|uniref:hypothetical protein n=1 Tax=Nocardia sp. NBC_00511 TaxID=2903591 RepID=UPI0030E01C8B